ncbi:MAG: mercury methylation corrinoid protein HgcA [Bacteroidetes bacterium]|nr:mercury methylation corrinoid protein HgcA [Bacteroidota bacterium]
MSSGYIIGVIETTAGNIPRISTKWSATDIWSAMKTRWSIGRMHYKVLPGLYAIGNPDENSNVFVTGNFKLSFDHVRRALTGLDAWALTLDTKGINVWCAAGKGTFSTKELTRQIGVTRLEKIISHRRIIVPQLGAVGISAHEVKRQTGFSVIYGPVRAADIPEFLRTGMKATKEMRTVDFPLWERLKLIPVELSYGKYYLLVVPAFFIILSGLNPHGYSLNLAVSDGLRSTVILLCAYLTGLVITPILLPWLPFRRFSLKGLITGLAAAVLLLAFHLLGTNNLETFSWLLMIGGLSSFLAMNFTGSSTFTSLSGVQKEMKTALPLQIGLTGLGLVAWIVSKFIFL